jgi:replicative DNA helicase
MTEELPHAPEAEAAVMGCLIENPTRYWPMACEAGLSSEFFHTPATSALWRIVSDLAKNDRSIDPATVRDAIKDKRPAGLGLAEFSKILLTEFSTQGWDGYIADLRDRLARRLTISAGMTVANENQSGETALSTLQDAARRAAAALSGSSSVANARASVEAFMDALQQRYSNGDLPGMATGMLAIDQKTGGMRPGELWVVGAPTSWGKSVFMLQAAGHAVREGKNVVVFTLEMGKEEIVARIVASQWSIPMGELMNPKTVKGFTMNKIERATKELKESGLMICDASDQSVETISGHCQRISDSKKIDLVVVDYLQLVSTPKVKGQNREQEVASISRGLKQLAKRLQCPVVTATQLNEQGKSRESRAIEHDADCVLFFSAADEPNGLQDVKFWKCRNGKRGEELKARMNGDLQQFTFS